VPDVGVFSSAGIFSKIHYFLISTVVDLAKDPALETTIIISKNLKTSAAPRRGFD
jgi:hypothetical protein